MADGKNMKGYRRHMPVGSITAYQAVQRAQHAHTIHQRSQLQQRPYNHLEVSSQMFIKLEYGSHIAAPAAEPQLNICILTMCRSLFHSNDM